MAKPKVFVTKKLPAEVLDFLAGHCELDVWEEKAPPTREQLMERVADAEGLLTSGYRIDEELLDRAPKLKVVSNFSVGYNNFDLAAMKQRGVIGTNTPDVLNETVADLTFSLILGAARRVAELDRYVRQGLWKRGDDENLYGIDVHHATLGIIGMGRIGEAVARRAKFGFSMDVLYYNRSRKPEAERELGAEYVPLDELLKRSDFVVVLVPLTPETVKLIGRDQFALMKPSAIFINVSRGQTVDEEALVEALEQGRIRGAGLDVFAREPIGADHPLLKFPNVVALPHIGSATAKTRLDMAMLAARNLVSALEGRVPPNIVPELRP